MTYDPYGSSGYGGGGMGVMPFTDPAMMAAMNRQRYAQALLEKGMSTAPTTTLFGALARGIQGWLGGRENQAALQQMQGVQQRQQQEAAGFMSGNIPGTVGPGADSQSQGGQPSPSPAQPTPGNVPSQGYTLAPPGTPDDAKMLQISLRESGGRNVNTAILGSDGKPASTASGYWQITDPTWRDIAPSAGIDLKQYPRAIDAPYDVQKQAAYALFQQRGEEPWQSSAPGGPDAVQSTPETRVSLGVGQNDVGQGFQIAQQLRQRAQAAMVSTNPYIRAMAPQLMQQATSYMQLGAWSSPQRMPNGQYMIRNLVSGETKLVGDQPRPEAHFADIISQVSQMRAAGQPIPPALQQDYAVAYSRLYPTETGIDPVTNQPRAPYQAHPPPPGIVAPEQLNQPPAAPGTPQGASTAVPGQTPPPGASPPPAAPTAAPAGQPAPSGAGQASPAQIAAAQAGYQQQVDEDQKQAAEDYHNAAAGQSTFGTTQAIRNLLPSVRTGVSGDARLQAARVMADLGGDPKSIQSLTGTDPAAGEQINKLLGQQILDKVRALGAHEAGSVVQYVSNINPSLASRPETIDEMSRVMDMLQLRNYNRANAQKAWLNQQQANMATSTEPNIASRLGAYKGLQGFDDDFNKNNDARVYLGAAFAAAGKPFAQWSGGLSDQQKQQALTLAASVYPDARIWWGKQQIMPHPATTGASGG